MGAEMLVYTIWIREGKTPNWDNARKAVKALRWGNGGDALPRYAEEGNTFTALEAEHEDGPEAEAALQEFVSDHLELVIKGIENFGTRAGLRELGRSDYGGWNVYVTGGMSWGDRPTELSLSFDVLEELEILDAADLTMDSNAVQISL